MPPIEHLTAGQGMIEQRVGSIPAETASPNQVPPSLKKNNRKRAAFACKPCNARRLKCDAVEIGLPCSRCRSLDQRSECELHQSKRGKYVRSSTKSAESSPLVAIQGPPILNSLAMISDVAAATQPLLPIRSSSAGPTPDWMDMVAPADNSANDACGNVDLREPSPTFSTRPPSPKAPTDMVYANLYEDNRKSQPQSQTIIYMGHATHNLSYILNHRGRAIPSFLHYSISEDAATHKPLTPEEQTFYRSRGDYDVPPPPVQDELIRTYFSVVHPAYPILDRVQFAKSYRSQTHPPSLLLLQAMFMVAATHCPLDVLTKGAGYNSRHEAKRAFYRRAKALYDCDYESNRIVNIQTLFLLQFWWESPLEQKDSGFWLMGATGLAQGCGMHRSTERAGLSPSDRILWRRIWSCIWIRDAHLALAFGKPLQINEADCDVEALSEADFVENGIEEIDQSFFGCCTRQHVLFVMNMMRLHKAAVNICLGHRPAGSKERLSDARLQLIEWSKTVEPELRYESNPQPDLWVRVLHVFSSYLTIMIHRSESTSSAGENGGSPHALRAANIINLLFDELLTMNEIHLCPVYLVPCLFAAMSVHLSMAGFLDSTGRVDRIAKHRLRVSMMAMKELSGFWPVCNWIFQLFTKIIKESSKGNQSREATANSSFAGTPGKHGGQAVGQQAEDNYASGTFGSWAEIEEFTSAWGIADGFEFDFSHSFDGVSGGLVNFNADSSGTGTSVADFPPFLGS